MSNLSAGVVSIIFFIRYAHSQVVGMLNSFKMLQIITFFMNWFLNDYPKQWHFMTGFIMKLPIWDSPEGDLFFDDNHAWTVAEEGFPGFSKKYQNADKSNEETKM